MLVFHYLLNKSLLFCCKLSKCVLYSGMETVTLATASKDRTVRLWKVTGNRFEAAATLSEHKSD